jgi:hypothetical protein
MRLEIMEKAKETAQRILNALKFKVEEIPETNEKRADLMVRDSKNCYVIENKEKDDIELSQEQLDALYNGEVVSDGQATTQHNAIAGIFTKARDQLDATPADDGAFRLIWFQADGIDRQLFWDRAFATFYGQVNLFPRPDGTNDVIGCYYFDYATSISMPTVDAMILCDGRYLQLLLNEFSPNVDKFIESDLYNVFVPIGAIVDPRKLESEGRILTFRYDMPRKNDNDRLAAIEAETGLKYHVIRFTRYAARVLSPKKTDGDSAA